MAILVFSAPIAGLRGTIGGVTYSANGSGPFARQWVKGTDLRTSLQSVERGRLGLLPAQWRVLSVMSKALWGLFAAQPGQELTNSLGQPYYLSGYQWYVKINRWRQEVGWSLLSNPPTLGKAVVPTATYVRWVTPPTSSILVWAGGPNPGVMCLLKWRVVFGATPDVASSGFWMNNYMIFGAVNSLYFTWNKTFGDPQTGFRAFFRVYSLGSEGYRSDAQACTKQFPYTGAW